MPKDEAWIEPLILSIQVMYRLESVEATPSDGRPPKIPIPSAIPPIILRAQAPKSDRRIAVYVV